MGTWTADTSKGSRARDWTWTYDEPLPWNPGRGRPGDVARLMEWIGDMKRWGLMVATKCKDLEARVAELETEYDRLKGQKGGSR
jgi:hypothetical protein